MWHAPWYESEVGRDGLRLVENVAAALDPTGILNPHVLLDPTDRLEV
jgi:FAD/FMN-containing dehydrogenase